MANLNKVFLMGNLTRDPELNYTANGTSVVKLGIAVNRKFKQGDDWKTEVQYFNIVVWGKAGENCAKYLSKGRAVLVEERLQTRSWEAQDGSKRYATEIVADQVQFIGSGSGEEKPKANDDIRDTFGAAGFTEEDQEAMPF